MFGWDLSFTRFFHWLHVRDARQIYLPRSQAETYSKHMFLEGAFLTRESILCPGATIEELLNLTHFTLSEAQQLVRIRQYYQNGGSDRADVVRQWLFVKMLLQKGMLES